MAWSIISFVSNKSSFESSSKSVLKIVAPVAGLPSKVILLISVECSGDFWVTQDGQEQNSGCLYTCPLNLVIINWVNSVRDTAQNHSSPQFSIIFVYMRSIALLQQQIVEPWQMGTHLESTINEDGEKKHIHRQRKVM